ncbi:MAG TPA: Crp/Fnr family transcriptional regulator [Tepidisphaeraceae bacterium]|jgi:CRP-like cAMP-binding protein
MPIAADEGAIVRLLATTDLFKALAADDLAACAAKFRVIRFAKGQLLFGRGDTGTHLYLVAEGQVRLAIATSEGRELSFQIAAVGDLIGEIAVLDGGPRSAEATALTAVTTYALERNAFRELWSGHPSISSAVISFLCWRLRDASDRLEAIALYPMEVRLARFLLLALAGRQVSPGRRVPLELGFTQGELAMLLGASRPKINLALGMLETAGAIGRTSDRLFCDPAKLASIAQLDDGGAT